MNRIEQIRLMAEYNQWMNRKVYAAASTLTDAALAADRQAFFGSILGTLNHLALGDTVWLKRFAEHPAGFDALAALGAVATPRDLKALAFADIRELHFFNHQTHHRGQVTTLLTQAGVDVGDTDLLALID
ncbi:DinB family protein [Pseudomonas kitaguniensis]|uniref:DinB family protein n=1 Tax=Pseudomonas kitaguniensis TaxID=2607908 RepID=UPI003D08D291